MLLKRVAMVILLMSPFGLSCCVIFPNQPSLLYTNYSQFTTGVYLPQQIGPKKGESYMQNILGLVSLGDASVQEAAKKSGISKVTSVDFKVTDILHLYGQLCVIVTGE